MIDATQAGSHVSRLRNRSMTLDEFRFSAGERAGDVPAILLMPRPSHALFIIAHGAGAGMRHPFMEALAQRLAATGVATLRYQFPYMERQSRRPDPESILTATVRAAVAAAAGKAPGLPLFAGGKSMGGRMTSLTEARESLVNVRGLVFFGFPLHPAGRPSISRSAHLSAIRKPLLFLQGSRDSLADLNLLRPLCANLSEWAELVVVEGADHSFRMLRRSGRTEDEVLGELAAAAAAWADRAAVRTPQQSDWITNDQR